MDFLTESVHDKPDRSELHAVMDKISLLSESTDKRKGLEKFNEQQILANQAT